MVTFHSEKISAKITRIYAPGGEQMYLIEGTEKAALIDSGSGVGDLRAFVKTLTDRPLMVLLTHNHIDHAMGTAQFETVYISTVDKNHFDLDDADRDRRKYLSFSKESARIEESDYIAVDDPNRFLVIHDGETFNLGGCSITALSYGGHTAGSMVFLVNEERTLLLGDAAGNFTMLQNATCLTLEMYKKHTAEVANRIKGKTDRLLLSHDRVTPPNNLLEEMMELCDEIQESKDDKVPYNFMGTDGLIAKRCGYGKNCRYGESDHMRYDGGFGNIIYNPRQI